MGLPFIANEQTGAFTEQDWIILSEATDPSHPVLSAGH